MAPIDPQQILKAFEPVCSQNGGIINLKEVPKLSGLIKEYSQKLVSKCTYCNILLSTDEKVLEEFLNHDGWETINSWLKDAIEKGNDEFLIELIKVLNKCPITVERLKKNDTPKLLKNIGKSGKKDLSKNAKELITKWKNFVNQNFDPESKEKRKLKDSSNSNRETNQTNLTKKLKIDKDENINLNNAQDNQKDTVKMDNHEQNESGVKIKSTKCKLGKTRSIGVLEKTSYSKPISTSGLLHANQNSDQKLPTNHPNVGNSFITKNASMLLNHTASTPSLPLNKLNKNDKNNIHIQIIDPQPLPITELTNPTTSQSNKHVIKESAGFMDALSSVPTSKIKKKKKTSVSVPDKTSNNNKEEKMEINNSLNDSNDFNYPSSSSNDNKLSSNDSNTISDTSLNKTVESEFLVFSKESPFDPEKKPEKGILQYVAKGRKRNICWAVDEKLENVKYIELDDKERCNVYKQNQNFNDHRKEEMVKERSQINNLRGQMKYLTNNPGVCYFTWRLIKIENLVEGEHFYVTGKDSVEKNIQAERLKDVLELIDLPGKPEFPNEPDTSLNENLMESKTIEIFIGDDNCAITDYSNHQFHVSDDTNINSYSTNQPINTVSDNLYYQQMSNTTNLVNNQQFYNNLSNVNQLFNNPNIYGQQMHPNVYLNGNAQQPQPPVSNEQSRWSTSSWGEQVNHNNTNKNNKNQKSNKSKQPLVCKFWSKKNSCRHGSGCLFLHSR